MSTAGLLTISHSIWREGVYLGGVSAYVGLPRGGCLPGGVYPEERGVCLGSVCQEGGVCLGGAGGVSPPMDKILDTHLWKHYHSATTVAGGNNF